MKGNIKMNKNELDTHIGNNVLVTFKNGEAQVGKLQWAAVGDSPNTQMQYRVGKFGGPFKPVNVSSVSADGFRSSVVSNALAGKAPKSDTGYKPAKRTSKTPAKKTTPPSKAKGLKPFTYNDRQRMVTIEATDLRDAKKKTEAAHSMRRGWTVKWEKVGTAHFMRVFNSKGTEQKNASVRLVAGTGPKSDSKPAAKATAPVKRAGMTASQKRADSASRARKSSGNVPATKPVGKRAASKPAKAPKPQRVIKVDKKTGRKTVLIVK